MRKLIDSEVKRKNMEVTIERVEQEIRNIATNNNIHAPQLTTALSARGVTCRNIRTLLRPASSARA